MIIVYFILVVLIIVFFTLGIITAQKEKRYNYNESNNQKKLETTSSSLNVERLIDELDEDIGKIETKEQSDPVIIESTLLSEILEMDEEEIK